MKHLVYIINLIIFAPKKVGRKASNINFPLFKAIDGLFYKPNFQSFKTSNYGKDYACNDGSLFLYNIHGRPEQ